MGEIEETIIEIGKDVLISLLILGIILGSLYAFSGRWPPMVVVESGSMMHSEESQVGVIDPGDIVLVQESDKEDITTYLEGRATGYRKYGQYGDVIVFEPDGNTQETPIIHRPVLYLEENNSAEGTFDIPILEQLEYEEDWETDEGEKYYNLTGEITIYDYYREKDLQIDLSQLNHGGYITKGDNNSDIDQQQSDQQQGHRNPISSEPIKEEWIKGRARGELPWFGIIKLLYLGRTEYIPSNSWNNFIISLAVILLLPLITEFGSKIYYEVVGERDGREDEHRPSEDTKYSENDDTSPPKNRESTGSEKDFESEISEEREKLEDTDAVENDDKLEP